MRSGNAAATDRPIVLLSGGFDPLHIGHLHLVAGAVHYGRIIVALNSDGWLVRKKGYCFMPWVERAAVVLAVKNVQDVIPVDDSDGTICEALRALQPDFFANGGDRETADPREHAVCEELGIKELFGVGGLKMQSSSKLVKEVRGLGQDLNLASPPLDLSPSVRVNR